MKRITFILLILALVLPACQKRGVHQFAGSALGTYFAITYVGEEDPDLPREVDSIFQVICKKYSIFDSTSVVSQINQNKPSDCPDDFLEMVKVSLEISKQTNGAFDITVGPLVNLWGFGNKAGKTVTEKEIDSVRAFVGYGKLKIEGRTIVKEDERIELNFNAIAKGKAVDDITEFLLKKGYTNCLVDVGGEVRNEGMKSEGKMWTIGIQVPTATKEGMVESDYLFHMPQKSVATSGNYRNYKEMNGERYSHITDPRTGQCKTSNLLSVSVIANDCMTADAYATAFMVMGIEESMEWLKAHKEIAAHFIYYENGQYQHVQTDNFPKMAAN